MLSLKLSIIFLKFSQLNSFSQNYTILKVFDIYNQAIVQTCCSHYTHSVTERACLTVSLDFIFPYYANAIQILNCGCPQETLSLRWLQHNVKRPQLRKQECIWSKVHLSLEDRNQNSWFWNNLDVKMTLRWPWSFTQTWLRIWWRYPTIPKTMYLCQGIKKE